LFRRCQVVAAFSTELAANRDFGFAVGALPFQLCAALLTELHAFTIFGTAVRAFHGRAS
jgi:hypothetical protein